MAIKIVVSRMKNADYNIGEQAVLASFLSEMSILNEIEIEVISNPTKFLQQKSENDTSYFSLSSILKTLRSIFKADIFIWGGGNMLQDQSSALDIPYHLIYVFVAQLFRTPIILYGVEIGPIDTKIGSIFSKKALSRAELILVRNKRSVEVLKRIGVSNPNIYVTADPAFLIPSDKKIFDRIKDRYGILDDRPVIGIMPRKAFYKKNSLLPATLALKFNLMPRDYFEKFPLFKRNIAQICDYLVREFDAQILFLPMDVAKNPRDDLICREIFDMMLMKEDAYLLEVGLNASEVSGLIESMDLLISQRLHGLILSCSMNTPMIGIASTGEQDKCRIFMNSIRQGNRCIDALSIIDETQRSAVFDLVNETWENRKEISKKLKLNSDVLKKKSSINIRLVSQFINNLKRA